MIEDLQRQVTKLRQRLAAQKLERNREMDDRDSDSSFETLYHNPIISQEQRGQEQQYRNLCFKVELPKFSRTL
jgi:hypothetical protein